MRAPGILSIDDVIDGIAADMSSLTALVKSEVERELMEDMPPVRAVRAAP